MSNYATALSDFENLQAGDRFSVLLAEGQQTKMHVNHCTVYEAYVDKGGSFRVIDETTKANKYAPKHFKILLNDYNNHVWCDPGSMLHNAVGHLMVKQANAKQAHVQAQTPNVPLPHDQLGNAVADAIMNGAHITIDTLAQTPMFVSPSAPSTPAQEVDASALLSVDLNTALLGVDLNTTAFGSYTELRDHVLEVAKAHPDLTPADIVNVFYASNPQQSQQPLAPKFPPSTIHLSGGTPPYAVAEIEGIPEVAEALPKVNVNTNAPTQTLSGYLVDTQNVPKYLIKGIKEFRDEHDFDDDVLDARVPEVAIQDLYDGSENWIVAITALLQGKHLLLAGGKATGKNTLATSLAAVFYRPIWDVACHVGIDVAGLVGTDTFRDGQVTLRPGAITECARAGGFAVLDEVNMARSEVLSMLHQVTDKRRVLEIPGYERINIHPATRLIGTMNYGYMGTRVLNEAFVSRFVPIQFNSPTLDELVKLLKRQFSTVNESVLRCYSKIFKTLDDKARNGEVGSEVVDLRGIIDALDMTLAGLATKLSLRINVANKTFDDVTRKVVLDTIDTNMPNRVTPQDISNPKYVIA